MTVMVKKFENKGDDGGWRPELPSYLCFGKKSLGLWGVYNGGYGLDPELSSYFLLKQFSHLLFFYILCNFREMFWLFALLSVCF